MEHPIQRVGSHFEHKEYLFSGQIYTLNQHLYMICENNNIAHVWAMLLVEPFLTFGAK